ncbi:PilZ domain-containing protein [Novosphingobium sp. ZN18A2]|uniref:PilZ domain-containing protein n=1 Tax=Novosphingobium sp. ZN18A2 TaxID=3079861 RepID=UPI0030D41E32
MEYAPFNPREPRYQVHCPATARSGRRKTRVLILNWSSHGMMISSPLPPRQGELVEIRSGAGSWTAIVIWNSANRFGVRTREQVILDGTPEPIWNRLTTVGEDLRRIVASLRLRAVRHPWQDDDAC